MSQSTVQFLADQPLPLELKTIHVAANGALSRRTADQLAFRFHFGGVPFEAAARRDLAGTHLVIEGMLGYLPFSAEGISRRVDVATIVQGSHGMRHGRFVVSPGQQIRLVAEIAVEMPMTPVSVIAATVDVLLNAKPWLDLLGLYLMPVNRPAAAGA